MTNGMPTRECPMCGSDWFLIQAQFDEEGELTMYALDGECNTCGHRVTVPTPIDYIHLKRKLGVVT